MQQNLLINGEAVAASQEGVLVVELFLKDNYRFRRNVLNGKVEFLTLPEGEDTQWRPLTPEALNSIFLKAERENILEKGGTEKAMDLYVRFRGGEPTINALLERDGIKVQKIN